MGNTEREQWVSQWQRTLSALNLDLEEQCHDVIINLIASTRTRTGLKIHAELDKGNYPTGIMVSDEELAAVNMKRADFHGDWNYAILPTRNKI